MTLRAGAIVIVERRARAGPPNSKQSVELLSRAAKAGILRQSCAAPVQQCQDQAFAWPRLGISQKTTGLVETGQRRWRSSRGCSVNSGQ
jgi:hypothetical protein